MKKIVKNEMMKAHDLAREVYSQVSIEDRIELYRVAKINLVEGEVAGICSCLAKAILVDDVLSLSHYVKSRINRLDCIGIICPELMEYKPMVRGESKFGYWWSVGFKDVRIGVIDSILFSLEVDKKTRSLEID